MSIKGFINLEEYEGRRILISVNDIAFVQWWEDGEDDHEDQGVIEYTPTDGPKTSDLRGHVAIWMKTGGPFGVRETFEQVERLIEEAT